MVRSMTGYGRGEGIYPERTITVELRAVNNRYLDCTVKMPRAYIFAEDAIKARVQQVISRGKVDVFVSLSNTGEDTISVVVNESLVSAYLDALEKIRTLGRGIIHAECSASELARFSEVLTLEKKEEDHDTVKAQLIEVLDMALDDFAAMREREGTKLAEDILSRAEAVEKLVAEVEARSPQTISEYRARLEAKMQEVLQNVQIDQGRLLTEAAIFADKVAVDEETVRLKSHISQLREMLDKGGAVGRKLDFLIQEFNREANTIGSKCNDIDIARTVVDMKAEIEKIREQVQNLE